MILDGVTVWAMTALVVNVCGAAYLAQMLLRRDVAVKSWSAAFLSAMATTVCYLTAAVAPETMWAVPVGNALFAMGIGLLWTGCREVNRRRIGAAVAAAAGASIAVAAAAAVMPAQDGGWQGAAVMFAAVAALAAAGARECLRGRLRRMPTAAALLVVLCLVSLFYIARLGLYLSVGVEHVAFSVWLGPITANMITIVLSIVSLLATALLRAMESGRSGTVRGATGRAPAGILTAGPLLSSLRDLAERAQWHGETVGVVVVRAEGLPSIERAFGAATADAAAAAMHRGVRTHAPSSAVIGENGPDAVAVGLLVGSEDELRAQAMEMYRGVFDATAAAPGGVVPVIGVGAALSTRYGYDGVALMRAARSAAQRGIDNADATVVIAHTAAPVTASAGSASASPGGEPVADAAHGLDPARR